jgi:hypothetical protein
VPLEVKTWTLRSLPVATGISAVVATVPPVMGKFRVVLVPVAGVSSVTEPPPEELRRTGMAR